MSIKSFTLNGVATIEIARPEKKNALTIDMYRRLAEAILEAQQDADVRALLVTGQPGIFTSGNDLEDFLKNPPGAGGSNALDSPVFRFMEVLVRCDKPVVAAVTGPAIGIGTTMLLHCDLVYVSDEARLAMPFTSLGLVCEFASSLLLPRLIGRAKASEKLLLGDPISPSEAVALGFANAVVPAAEVVAHARRVAERFNSLPAGSVGETKRLMRRATEEAIMEAIAAEGEAFGRLLKSPEAKEALSAFLAKRSPDFSRL